MPQVSEAFLHMQGHRVIDLGAHAIRGEMLTQQIAVAGANDVLIVDVTRPGPGHRRLYRPAEVGTLEHRIVEARVALPGGAPGIQLLELDVEDSRLDLIQPEVAADQRVEILGLAAMD